MMMVIIMVAEVVMDVVVVMIITMIMVLLYHMLSHRSKRATVPEKAGRKHRGKGKQYNTFEYT
jgi:hypothetical protein